MRLKPGRKAPPPTRGAYDEWAAYLEAWGRGETPDGSALPALDPKDFAGDTWARLMGRLTDAIGARLESWQQALVRATNAAMRDEFEFGRALQQSRDGVHPIRALATDPRLPEQVRERLAETVDRQLEQMQQRLEEDTQRQRDRGDSARLVEARLRTLRDNALTAVTVQAKAELTTAVAPPPEGLPRKRIIQR